MTFKDLGLKDELIKAVTKQGYESPSPIQIKAIPVILERKDILASSQTGTGKTAGFVLPILQLLSSNEDKNRKRQVKTLILTPTRELAAQIYDNAVKYAEFLDIRSAVVFGGVNINPQINTLRNGIDILVATPGRLLDLHGQRAVSLNNVEILVLDEADRMLDMGFAKDIKRILAILPERRQNLLFSATFSLEIKRLASGILHNPELVEATPENTTVELIEQSFYRIDAKSKTDLTIDLIYDGKWEQVLIFTRTKHGANKLTEKLIKADISAAAIHGNKTQNARTKALDGFKKGEVRVLVATDIAARGLDIPLLPHVINFELPNVPEDYVHRIGRTGRAGASGEAISLVCIDELEYLRGIEKLLDLKIKPDIMKGYEPTETQLSPKKEQGGRRFDRTRENQAKKPQHANAGNKDKRYNPSR